MTKPHPCPRPTATKKHRHAVWVCDCGQGWIARHWENYAGDGYDWVAWPGDYR